MRSLRNAVYSGFPTVRRMFLIHLLCPSASVAALAFCVSSLAQSPVRTGDFRRVVTKLDESGGAVVMIDERAPVLATRSANGTADIWATMKSPAQLSMTEDLGKTKLGISPPRHGTSFRVVDVLEVR